MHRPSLCGLCGLWLVTPPPLYKLRPCPSYSSYCVHCLYKGGRPCSSSVLPGGGHILQGWIGGICHMQNGTPRLTIRHLPLGGRRHRARHSCGACTGPGLFHPLSEGERTVWPQELRPEGLDLPLTVGVRNWVGKAKTPPPALGWPAAGPRLENSEVRSRPWHPPPLPCASTRQVRKVMVRPGPGA